MYELEHCLPIDELCEWVAYFDLKNNPDTEPLANNPEAEYAAMRNVLN